MSRSRGFRRSSCAIQCWAPATDISFIEEARKTFIAESAYLDDRPGAPMRFLAEANLRQIIRREAHHVDAEDARAQLNDRIRQIFSGQTFETVPFPGGPFDVPDEVGDGRPKLVVVPADAPLVTPDGRVTLRPTAVVGAQHGGFTAGSSPASWGSIDECCVN